MRKIIVSIMISLVLFSSLPPSIFAADPVYTHSYYVSYRDEYRVDHTGMPALTFHEFRLHFTAADSTVYTLDWGSYTGIMYLTCNGVYKLQFIDEMENILTESEEIITTQIVNPTCNSYPEQTGADDLGATQTDNGDGTHNLDWSSVPGADTYEVWKDGVLVGETSDTSFTLDSPGSVTIVARDTNGNEVGSSDMQVPTYDGGSSWGGSDPGTCDTCQKLSDLLACPDWSTYMGEWQATITAALPPPPDWNVVSQTFADTFVNTFDTYFGDMPEPPTRAEIVTNTETPLPPLDTSYDAAENIEPDMPEEYNQPIDFDLSDAPVIEVVDESEPFIILDPLHDMDTSPVGVGVIPGDPNNSSGDIAQPQTIEGLEVPTPTVTEGVYDPIPVPGIDYDHSDIPKPADNSTGTGAIPGITTP